MCARLPVLLISHTFLSLDQGNSDLIEQRRRGFELFLRRVTCHPTLRLSRDVRLFLTASEEDVAVAIRLSKEESQMNKKELLQKLKKELFGGPVCVACSFSRALVRLVSLHCGCAVITFWERCR